MNTLYKLLTIILLFLLISSCNQGNNTELYIEKYDTIRIKAKGAIIDNKREGYWVFYNENGIIDREQIYCNGKITGAINMYYDNGVINTKGQMNNNESTGTWYYYYISGKLKMKGTFKRDKPYGTWEYYVDDGRLDKKVEYDKGKVKVLIDNHIGPPIDSEP